MPNPIELLLDPVSLIIFVMYGLLILWETLFPARTLPRVGAWRFRGVVMFFSFFFLSSYLPMLWDETLAQYQLIDLQSLGVLGGTIVGLLVYELGVYVWHRSMHRSMLLWRTFHQMHHSVERLDSYSAFYFSPFDMIGWALLASLTLVLIVGLPPAAVTYIILLTTFIAVFTHTNVRTPRWLGYIIQRPEAHAVHHARGVHAYNYSDLPLFDILFGSFRNPQSFVAETGFYAGASDRIVDMLLFKDVSKPKDTTDAAASAQAVLQSR